MREASGRVDAALVRDGVELDARDVSLLGEIDDTGSIAKASTNLGRSRAQDLARIETLEDAFGQLVDRHRGGSGGGGSELTETAIRLLSQYRRLQVALTATAQVPETVLEGRVRSVAGELATVETAVGTVRGLHDGLSSGDDLQVRIGADTVTILAPDDDPEPDSTSARNRFRGTVSSIDRGDTVCTVGIEVDEIPFQALITNESATRLGLEAGSDVLLTFKATATRLVGV